MNTLIIMTGTLSRPTNPHIKFLGQSVTDEHSQIKGTKLPTTKQVLIAYISTRIRLAKLVGLKRYRISLQSKELVYKEIERHYVKAGIKLASERIVHNFLDKVFKIISCPKSKESCIRI